MLKSLHKDSEKGDLLGGLTLLFACVAAAMVLALIGTMLFNRYTATLPPDKEWGIARVEQMPYIQGELKQEFLKQINEAKTDQEIGNIVSQAQKDNDNIRVTVAALRIYNEQNGGNK